MSKLVLYKNSIIITTNGKLSWSLKYIYKFYRQYCKMNNIGNENI